MTGKTVISFMTLLLFFISVPAFAAQPAEADFGITAVTVYNGMALVERKAVLSLPSGEAVFTVKDLPMELYPNTLLVYKADKSAPVLIKEFEFRDIEAAVILKEEEKKLSERLESLNDELKAKQDRAEVLKAKIKFYDALSGKAAGDAAQELGRKDINVKNTAEVLYFIAAGTEAALKENRVIEKQIEKIKDNIRITQSELSGLNARNTKTSKILHIRTSSNAAQNAEIRIKYAVPSVYWYPAYECDYISDKGEIAAGYYAMIQQSTSESWNNVKLTIATGTPLFDVTLPEPQPWILDEQRVYAAAGRTRSAPAKKSMAYDMAGVAAEESLAEAAPVLQAPAAAEFRQEELNIKAALTGRFSVSNKGETKKAVLKDMKLKKKDAFYTAVPSLNEAAYLTVEFENNDELVMMPGEVSLYMDGNYSGKANISNTVRKGESLKFSFGIDENIKIKKENLQEKKGESGIFGSEKKTDFGRKITVENYKQREITIYVKEPMPFSANDKIHVDIYETGIKTDSIEERGIYVWKLVLKPGEKKEILYRFKVTHPKEMKVGGI